MSAPTSWALFREVFRFEWRLRLRSAATWICLAVLILLVFRDMMSSYWDNLMGSGRVPRNSSFGAYMLLMFSTFWASALAAGFMTAPLLRDQRLRLAGILQSTPVSDATYFWGKYLAGIAGMLVATSGTVVGLALLPIVAPLVGGNPAEYGPTLWGHLLHGWLLYTVPGVLVHGTAHFLIAARTRSLIGSYAYVSLHMIVWIVLEVLFANGTVPVLFQIFDPIGKSALDGQMIYWSATERTQGWLSLSGPVAWNRLVHLGAAACFLGLARWGFRWRGAFDRPAKSQPTEAAPATRAAGRPAPLWTAARDWRGFVWMIAWRELRLCVRTPMFRLMFGLGIIPSFCAALNLAGYGDVSDGVPLPTFATAFIPAVQVFYLMMMFLVVFYAGEIASRERTLRVAPLVDASPVPPTTWWSGKVLGVILLAATIFCSPLIGYLAAQTVSGWWAPEWGRLSLLLGLNYLTPNIGMGCLAVFLHRVIPNRGIAHGAAIVIGMSIPIMHEIGVVENALAQPFLPLEGLFRSAFAVHEAALAKVVWFNAYWAGLGLICLGLGLLLGAQGSESGLGAVLRNFRTRLRPAPLGVLALGLLVTTFAARGIHQRMNVANHYQSRAAEDTERAAYERTYGSWRNQPAPRWAGGHLTVELFPGERRARFTADVRLTLAAGSGSMDKMLLNLPENVALASVEIDGRPAVLQVDGDLRTVIVQAATPFSGARPIPARFVWSATYSGFANHGWAGLISPGASLITPELLPVLGYDAEREIKLRGTRASRGLAERASRMRHADTLAVQTDAAAGLWEIEVESDAALPALAPGDLIAETKTGSRLRRTFRMPGPGQPPLFVIAAPYVAKKSEIEGTKLSLFAHADHTFNHAHWEAAARAALSRLRPVLGAYPSQEIRLVEVPQLYLAEPVACGNLLLIPETKGWLHDYRKPVALDWIGYITARELARGWIAQSFPAGDTAGSVLLTQGLPAALALWTLEATNPEGAKKYRLRLTDRYLRESNLEDGREPALVESDDEQYLADKAAVMIDAARRRMGDERFAGVLAGPRERDPVRFAAALENAVAAPDRAAVRESLQSVVVYDLRVRRAEAVAEGGGWSVRAELAAQRFVATAQDNRTPEEITRLGFPVRMTSADSPPLEATALFATGEETWTTVSTAKPQTLAIDAALLWIDRDRGNNETKVVFPAKR
ncbi:MAG TPA: hypothetical protein VG734_21565 [Lacunisphaera sp.]|nr:hypothetical protein [Lacunisphaera sp.]